MIEVLELIAESAPHNFLHNGVSLQDMKLMARVLFETLIYDDEGNLKYFLFILFYLQSIS